MKMKKLFVVLTTVLFLSIGLWSCLDGGNSRSYENVPAIVVFSGGTKMIQTPYDALPYAAPSLPSTYYPGDYLVVGYTIDYDNQPSSEYMTVTNLTVNEELNSSEVIISSGEEAKNYMYDTATDSIVEMGSGIYFAGAWFNTFKSKASKIIYDYDMVFNTDSVKPGSEIYSVYILPKNTSRELTYSSEYRNYAFDIENLLYSSYAKDTTISGYDYRLSKVNVFYKIGTKNGKNVFKAHISNPIMLSMLKPKSGL